MRLCNSRQFSQDPWLFQSSDPLFLFPLEKLPYIVGVKTLFAQNLSARFYWKYFGTISSNPFFCHKFGFDFTQFLRSFDFFEELFISGNIVWWTTHHMPKEKKRHLIISFSDTEVIKETFGNIARVSKITAPPLVFCDFVKNESSNPLFYFIISQDTYQGPNPENLSKICRPLFWQ